MIVHVEDIADIVATWQTWERVDSMGGWWVTTHSTGSKQFVQDDD